MSHFSSNSFAYTYGVKNESGNALEVTLDFSSSENMAYSSKSPIVKKVVKPGEFQFMLHTQAGFGNYNKVLRHSGKEAAAKK